MMRNTKKIFFLWLFIFLGIFLPGQAVFAAWYDFLIGAITFIPMVTIALILVVAVSLANLLAAFSGLVLNWVLSPGFIDWSYTNPATNPIVATGLNITQSFVNMILVLVLVFIALATILRLAGYEIKKLLPTFIIIALLVNFAPVLTGLIVDATNIVMNFFVKEITGGKQLISMFKTLGDVLSGGISWETFKATKQIEIVLQLVVLIFVNLSLHLILLLFALIFMIRYIAIWLLVILSPLAFVCYILPATRRFFDLWLKQFLQWSIIGITMGFFLYLADQFATLNPTLPPAEGLGGAILPALFPLVFLYLGFIFGLQTGATGASTVINIGKRGGKWMQRVGGKTGRDLVSRAIASQWAEKRGLKERLERQAMARLPGFKGKTWGGKVATALGYATGAIPTYWALRRGLGEASLRITEGGRADVRAAEEEYKGATPERMASGLLVPRLIPPRAVGILRQAIEEGKIAVVKKELAKSYEREVSRALGPGATPEQIAKEASKRANEEIIKIGRTALRVHPEIFKPIRNAFPLLAEEMGRTFSQTTKEAAGLTFKDAAEAALYKNSIATKIIARAGPRDIPKMDEESFYTKEGRRAIHQFWTGEHVSVAGREFGKKFIDQFQKVAIRLGRSWYENKNPALAKYLRSSAARGLGIGF